MSSIANLHFTKEHFGSGVLLFFTLFSLLSITYLTNASNASAFINPNFIGPSSINSPIVIAPINPSMGSFYGGGIYDPGYGGGLGYGGGIGGQSFGTGLIGLLPQGLGPDLGNSGFGLGYGGGIGGQSFGTGLIGLLPQVFSGIGSLFSQGHGSSFDSGFNSGGIFGQPLHQSHGLSNIFSGIGSLFSQGHGSSFDNGYGYGDGYQSHDDQSFTEFHPSSDPFKIGSDSSSDQSNDLTDFDSKSSSSSSPFEDLRSIDSSSTGDPFSSDESSDSSQ
jgi:hypothetical protein